MRHLEYRPDIEVRAEGEQETIDALAETFIAMHDKVLADEGKGLRPSHAKSTGLLKGSFSVDDGLPEELAQGVCAMPARFEALVRLAQGPGATLPDRVSTTRGMSVKLLGVPGARIPEATERTTQDLLMEAGMTSFPNATPAAFLVTLRAIVSKSLYLPDPLMAAGSKLARAANMALEAVGAPSKTLAFLGHPPLHPLSEVYFSQAPLRWGRHVAKLAFFPTRETLDCLADPEIRIDTDADAFRAALVDHFSHAGASFELRVQLAVDPELTPIEDGAKDWPEDVSPYRRVGCLTCPPQAAWSPERSEIVDGRIAFSPANAIEAHRPLGGLMRARLRLYGLVAAHRQRVNGVRPLEIGSLAEIPD